MIWTDAKACEAARSRGSEEPANGGLCRCEWCKRLFQRLQAAHIFARGRDNGDQVDIPENLCGLCALCHIDNEAGHRPTREDLLLIAAQREGTLQDSIERMIYAVRRFDGKHLGRLAQREAVEEIRRIYR